MLRSLTKLPLRRCLHTSSSRPASTARSSRFGALAGAAAAATVYFAWKSFYGETIALDSASSPSKQVPLTPKASLSPDTISHSSSTAAQHEPSIHAEPTSHTSEDDSTPSTEPSEPSADAVGATEGEEEAAGGGGAFNPVTGEINWDCPCLGGMAHGICGEQFREAFSCFVYSEQEPKGIECVEKFKAMQNCFREHPDVYGEDIMGEDDDDEPQPAPSEAESETGAPAISQEGSAQSSGTPTAAKDSLQSSVASQSATPKKRTQAATA